MSATRKVYEWLKTAQHYLYPPLCTLCGRPGCRPYDLCSGCLGDLPRNDSCCRCCGIPLEAEGLICGPCSRKPPPFERSIIPFRYAPPLDHLLQQLKFHRRLHLAPLLGELLAEAVQREGGERPALLLPVPMSRSRIRERGYNQALELAGTLSRSLSIPLDWRQCQRVRNTPAQTSLTRSERRSNLRGAFAVKGRLPHHVAIVDDVVTTGTTVTEFARTLRRAGVGRVEVWACARSGGRY
ncbi:MAG: ComF family protein [Pseudomonadota bacterium]